MNETQKLNIKWWCFWKWRKLALVTIDQLSSQIHINRENLATFREKEEKLNAENKRLEALLNPKRESIKVKGHEIKPKALKGWVKRVYMEDKNA